MRLLLGDARAALIMTKDTAESMVRALEVTIANAPTTASSKDKNTWAEAQSKLEGALNDHRNKW